MPAPLAVAPSTRRELEHEVLVLILVSLGVQLVYPYRHDLPAHLVGGAGAMLMVTAAAPRAWGKAAPILGYALLVVVGWISEHLVFGPPDPVDVAFTLAGSLLPLAFCDRIRDRETPWRGSVLTAGLALIAGSLAYRYGMSRGAA